MPACSWCQCSGLAFATPCFCTARQSAAFIDLISTTCSAFGASRNPAPTASTLPRSQPPASAKRSCSRETSIPARRRSASTRSSSMSPRSKIRSWRPVGASGGDAQRRVSQIWRSQSVPSAEAPMP